MSIGLRGSASSGPPAPPTLIRGLWRMQGPSRVVAAALHRHPAGRELIVYFEGDGDDVLETRVERVDFAALERRAGELRNLLAVKVWVELKSMNE